MTHTPHPAPGADADGRTMDSEALLIQFTDKVMSNPLNAPSRIRCNGYEAQLLPNESVAVYRVWKNTPTGANFIGSGTFMEAIRIMQNAAPTESEATQ